jgi:hypothetical protein
MIIYAKLTGRLYQGCVECEGLHGITYMAKPVYAYPMISLPSEAWLKKYGNLFMAVLDFEQDKKERPLFMGILPLDDKVFPEKDSAERTYIVTEKFQVTISDDQERLTIAQLEGAKQSVVINSDNVTVTSKTVFLGASENAQKMILGEDLVKKLRDLIDTIKLITVPTGFGPSGMPINTPAFTAIEDTLDLLLSETNKLV